MVDVLGRLAGARARWIAAAALALAAGACVKPRVARDVEGRTIEGRYIPDHAYAMYARGAEAEARGALAEALAAYIAAADDDGDSAEIWTRIGAVRCALGGKSEEANSAFERASAIDPTYGPLWHERARCALARGELAPALAAADRAMQFDPDRDDTAILHAAILDKLGRSKEARSELQALTLRDPTSIAAWRARYELARKLGDTEVASEAATQLRALAPQVLKDVDRDPSREPLAALDAALLGDDLAAARRRALAAHLPAGEVAVRAAALGRLAAAREQAELVVRADPADTSARIALVVADDLSGNRDGIRSAIASIPTPREAPVSPSPLARLLFAELLDRYTGSDAARLWLGQVPDATQAADPLLARVAQRVRARLAVR